MLSNIFRRSVEVCVLDNTVALCGVHTASAHERQRASIVEHKVARITFIHGARLRSCALAYYLGVVWSILYYTIYSSIIGGGSSSSSSSVGLVLISLYNYLQDLSQINVIMLISRCKSVYK